MSAATHLAREGKITGVFLTAATDTLFGLYQDWVHQNTGIYLDVAINEDGNLKDICKTIVCLPTQRYDLPYSRFGKFFS